RRRQAGRRQAAIDGGPPAGLPRYRRWHQGAVDLLRRGVQAGPERQGAGCQECRRLPLHQGRGRAARLLQRLWRGHAEIAKGLSSPLREKAQRLEEDWSPTAIRLADCAAAILTSTSLTGSSVQAWVT